MSSIATAFQAKVASVLNAIFPNSNIRPSIKKAKVRTFYHVIQCQNISLDDLRTIIDSRTFDLDNWLSFAKKAEQIITTYLTIIQQNELTRLQIEEVQMNMMNKSSQTSSLSNSFIHNRSKTSRVNSIEHNSKKALSAGEDEIEKSQLINLISFAQHNVKSKELFMQFVVENKSTIFSNWSTNNSAIRNLKEILLLHDVQAYSPNDIINESQYAVYYQDVYDKLHGFLDRIDELKSILKQYEKGSKQKQESSLHWKSMMNACQSFCKVLLGEDIFNRKSNHFEDIIKYVLLLAQNQIQRIEIIELSIFRLKQQLHDSVYKVYYLCFMAQEELQQIDKQLQNIQQLKQQKISTKTDKLQKRIKGMISYLTESNQTIFVELYEAKLSECLSLTYQMSQTISLLLNLEKNGLFIENSSLLTVIGEKELIAKVRVIKQDYESVRPIKTQQEFQEIFSEIQHLMVLSNTSNRKISSVQEILIEFEKEVLKNYFYDEQGKRKQIELKINDLRKSKPNSSFRDSKMSVMSKMQRSSLFQPEIRQVFQSNLEELQIISSQNPQIDQEDTTEVLMQATRKYMSTINAVFGEELNDSVNFQPKILVELIKKLERKMTSKLQSQQQKKLEMMINSLKQAMAAIKPEINEQKVSQIFLPTVDAELFTSLRNMLIEHNFKISKILSDQVETQPEKQLSSQLLEFAKKRSNFLKVLMRNIDKLEQISNTIGDLNLNKKQYDLTSQLTFNLILKLVLALKEIKVFILELEDLKFEKKKDEISIKGIDLMCNVIYPSFIRSIENVFLIDHFPVTDSSNVCYLQQLLSLSEESKQLFELSNSFITHDLNDQTNLSAKKGSSTTKQFLTQTKSKLTVFKQIGISILEKIKANTGTKWNQRISSKNLERQLARIDELICVCEGEATSKTVEDKQSKQFLRLLSQFEGNVDS